MAFPLEYPFIQKAMLSGVLIAITCGVLGIYTVLRKLSFLSDAIAHSSLMGIAISLPLRINPLIGAFFTSIIAGVGIKRIGKDKISNDASMAIIFTFGLAAGIILLFMFKPTSVDVTSFLFGSILAIDQSDFYFSMAIAAISLSIASLMHHDLVHVCLDEDMARSSGVDVGKLDNVFFILVALATLSALRIAGVLLVSALTVVPASSALMFRKGFAQTTMLSVLFGVASVVLGIFASFYLNLPTGATIAACSVLIFLASKVANR
ncbi:MAG: metal ABC transporter permease [Candidatus Micrarchaeia archaeon]